MMSETVGAAVVLGAVLRCGHQQRAGASWARTLSPRARRAF